MDISAIISDTFLNSVLYSDTKISMRVVSDLYFKDVLQSYFELGGGKGEAPFLEV